MKAILLARVSTEEQKDAGNSLPAQMHRLQEYCKRKGFDVVEVFSFDESAYKTKRDEFDKILDFLANTKEKIAVCFDRVDRFSRNVFDKRVSLLYEKAVADHIELHFASDGQVINSSMSAVEKFQFGMSLGLAKYYSDSISDSVKRANEQLIRSGNWPGKAPIGYMNIADDNGKRTIILDVEKAHLVRKMFELYATGNESIKTIAAKMKKLGLQGYEGKILPPSMVYHTLTNPFYYGEMKYKKILYPHNYDRLISRQLYQKCQDIMTSYDKKNFQFAAKPFIFRGLIHCKKCGCVITPEIKKGKYTYYSCTNYKGLCAPRTYVPEQKLLEPIYEALKTIQMPQDRIEELTKALKNTAQSENRFHQQNMDALKKAYDKYESRLSKLLDEKIDGSITSEMYDKKVVEYKSEQNEILGQMQAHSDADQDFYLTANKVFSLAQRAAEIFESSEATEKRQLLSFLLQNCTLSGSNLSFELKEPFNLIVETRHQPIGLTGQDDYRTEIRAYKKHIWQREQMPV